jgi:hypothetical protein
MAPGCRAECSPIARQRNFGRAANWRSVWRNRASGNIMHRNYDNAGPDIPGLKKEFSPDADTVADDAVADMIAFDQLGPLTRAAITGMCVQLSALGVLQLIRQLYPGLHERNQQIDREMALMLRLADRDIRKLIDPA